jgi:hypothetical protein
MPRGKKKVGTEKLVKEKKVKITSLERKIERKCILIKPRIGILVGTIIVLQKDTRFYLALSYIDKQSNKKKDKILFSCPDLELIQGIGSKLSAMMNFTYISEPKEKNARKKRNHPELNIDRSIFREYNNHFFISLIFGTIILNDKTITGYWNNELVPILKMKVRDIKSHTSYDKCKEVLLSYDDELKKKVLKEVFKFGNTDYANTVKIVMGMEVKQPLPESDNEEPVEAFIEDEEGVEEETPKKIRKPRAKKVVTVEKPKRTRRTKAEMQKVKPNNKKNKRRG